VATDDELARRREGAWSGGAVVARTCRLGRRLHVLVEAAQILQQIMPSCAMETKLVDLHGDATNGGLLDTARMLRRIRRLRPYRWWHRSCFGPSWARSGFEGYDHSAAVWSAITMVQHALVRAGGGKWWGLCMLIHVVGGRWVCSHPCGWWVDHGDSAMISNVLQ
jgi:hypothetical protein